MTMPTQSPGEPLPPLVQPVPAQAIGYASGETVAGASSGARVLVGLIAGFHFLLGTPSVLGSFTGAISNVGSSGDPAAIAWALVGAALGAANIAVGIWMLVRRRWTWRASHITLSVLCLVNLVICGISAGMIVAFKGAKGMDAMAIGFGVLFFIVCSVLFWLHALSKLALLHLNVRRAFFMGDFEPHMLHRVGTFTMMILYGLVVLVCGVLFIVK